MKLIHNWKKASVCDIETDGFLDEVSKFHIVGLQLDGREDVTFLKGSDHERIKAMLQYHMDNEIPIVGHNFVLYDVPVFEKLLGMDLSKLLVIDTLALSWYLNINHPKHSIEALSGDYDTDIQKYFVDPEDWTHLDWEDAVSRVEADVKLNKIIWEDFKERLVDMYSRAKTEIDAGAVGGKRVSEDEELYIDSLVGLPVEEHINRILTFLMFKMDCIRLQEKTKWQVDVPYLKEHIAKLEEVVEKAAQELESVMPPVPEYSHRKEPAKPYKKNGELSATGKRWEALKAALKEEKKDEWGNLLVCVRKEGFISEITKYNPPNINGHQQVKDFLFSHGWIPQTFKTVRDKAAFTEWINSRPQEGSPRGAWTKWKEDRPEDRMIPQIRFDGDEGKELCQSVEELAETVPEIRALEDYSVAKHRLDTMKGILERVDEDGCVQASAHGFASTLRLKHRAPCVNMPAASKLYAEPIRGSFIAGDGFTSLGSDMSGLEDRVKHHFMLAHDPDYVSTMMSPTYDPHCQMAVTAGMMSVKDLEAYVEGTLTGSEKDRVSAARAKGKTTNYASVYNAGAATIARAAGVNLEEGKTLHEAYWGLNWSVKAIADEQVVVKDSLGKDWLVNPINGHLYSIRSEKDIFSTLAQGTGSFLFDMWLDEILTECEGRFNKKTLTYQAHDEFVMVVRDHPKSKELMSDIVRESLKRVNIKYKLRREMGCDIQYGRRYSSIH